MLSSRCFRVITRPNVFGLHRPFVTCPACLSNGITSVGRRSKQQNRHGDHCDLAGTHLRLSRYYSSNLQQSCSTLPSSHPTNDDDPSKQSIFQRFKSMTKKYWYIVIPVHLVTSAVWFGSFYFIASSGVDVPALLNSLRIPEWVIDKVRDGNSWKSYLLIAYGLYKIFTPLRYMVTLGGTTMTIRFMQKMGYGPKVPKH